MNGSLIRAARKAKHLTQADLAKSAGITQSYLSLIEAGKYTNATLAVLHRIATALDLSVEALLSQEAPAVTGAAA